jgi:hypothetical protein
LLAHPGHRLYLGHFLSFIVKYEKGFEYLLRATLGTALTAILLSPSVLCSGSGIQAVFSNQRPNPTAIPRAGTKGKPLSSDR